MAVRLRPTDEAESGTGGWLEIENEDVRALKSLILFRLKDISTYLEHAYQIHKNGQEIFEFLMEGLPFLVDDSLGATELTALVRRTGDMGVRTMALLDGTNADFGAQEISEINLGTRNRPGILISGHDFVDLKELLEQTEGKGIDIYPHSEMLPAHYRKELKKHGHLYANYGNAWHLQEAFGSESINDLPISFDIAWGPPTLSGFLSPAALDVLVEKFDIRPISTPETDVAAMMAGM